jgi:septal ring factor EnvC (AmiA/AmiB activator)
MIAEFVRIPGAVADRPRATISWSIVAASALLVAIVLYLLFAAYLPAKKRIVRLEAELRELYTREAQLQTRVARDAEHTGVRDQQLAAFTAERDKLAKRVDELERELEAAKKGRRSGR